MNKITKNVILAMAIVAVFLIAVVGSTSAGCIGVETGTDFGCGDTVTESCTFNGNMSCPSGHGLIVGADGIVIDGNGYVIVGSKCSDFYIAGIYSMEHSNVTIKNVKVTGFCDGIRISGKYKDEEGCIYTAENITIENCVVHDNGANNVKVHGIHFKPCVWNSTINNCTVYNQLGKKTQTCEDGGAGIRLHTYCYYNNITNNTIHNNALAGIYSKMICRHNYVLYNTVYENGEDVPDGHSYFGGGIRLECINTDNWTVEHNTVTDNWGPGIHVRGKNCIFRYNEERGSRNATTMRGDGSNTGVGDGFFACGVNQKLISNRFCDNEGEDIYISSGGSTTGDSDENTCDMTYNYDDAGTTRCTWECPTPMPDLTITEKSEEWVSFENKTYNITYIVKNIGNGDANASKACIYIDGILNMTNDVPKLNADASYINTLGPFMMSDNNDTIKVCADCEDNVTESDGTNNYMVNVFEYHEMPMPDLKINDKTEKWVDSEKKTYNVVYTVENIGDAKANASNTCIYIDDIFNRTDGVSELDPGASYTNELGPFSMSGDSDTIQVCADCAGNVLESDEDNNSTVNVFNYTEIGCVAGDGTVYKCGDTVTESCTFNGNMSCEGDGLIIGSGQVRIFGDGYSIEGGGTGTAVYSAGNTFLDVHDLEIKNFEKGIWLQHVGGIIYDYKMENCNITNNSVGIDVNNLDTRSFTVGNCEFHHNTKGIHVHGENGTNIEITGNKIYDNTVSGVYTEDVCMGCKIDYNVVRENRIGITVNASQWCLEHNLVTDSTGSGICVGGSDNILGYNTVGKNGDDGIHIGEGSENVTLMANTFCNNTDTDIFVDSSSNVSGSENACELTENYNDTGTIGCTYHCVGCIGDSGITYRCGSILTKSCAFNENIRCSEGNGLIVWADDIIINGANYTIDGVDTGNCGDRAGICSKGHDNITINNLEVENFCNGIKLKEGEIGAIYNCSIHDNGNLSGITTGTAGIWLKKFKKCSITNNTVYNIAGRMEGGCEDGGIGIRLHSFSNNCSITNNTIYNSSLAGIFSKMQCMCNNVTYNNIYENGVSYWKEQGLMTAGVRLQCIKTNHWAVENNTIKKNKGPGVYIRGCYDTLKQNEIEDNSGGGVEIVSNYNSLIENIICNNEEKDISVISGTSGNMGDNNTCETTENYDDEGTTGCTYACFAPSVFDTGEGNYPSIFGTHKGKIIPDKDITVNKMYTYPCKGTGGHTEYVRIWNESENVDGQGNWSGYQGDYHNITISPTITLLKNHEYNYTVITGSYPQIVHVWGHKAKEGGNITCEEFIDANEKVYGNWIPAIKLFLW